MPLPTTDLLKHVIGGAIGGERWSVSIWARLQGLTSNPTAAQMNTLAAGVRAGFVTGVWSGSPGMSSWCSSDTTVDSCHAYLYRSGLLAEQGTGTGTPSTGSGSQPHPGYVALVTTLLTAGSGRSRRGRWYWPATGIAIDSATSNLSSSTNAQTVLDKLKVWLQGFALGQPSWPGTPGEAIVVVSQRLAVSNDVTSLRVDSLPDTQHGRTRRLVPVFSVTSAM